MHISRYLLTIELVITIYSTPSFAMDSSELPLIQTVLFPISAQDSHLSPAYRMDFIDSQDTFFKITADNTSHAYPEYKHTLDFATTPFIKANWYVSEADFSYSIVPSQSPTNELPTARLCLEQVKKISELMKQGKNIVIWNGENAYKLLQIRTIQLSLTKQAITANNHIAKQELINAQQQISIIEQNQKTLKQEAEIRKLKEELERFKKAQDQQPLGRNYIYNNPNVRIISEEIRELPDTHYEDTAKTRLKESTKKIEQASEENFQQRKKSLYRVLVVGILATAGALWYFFKK